MLVSLLYYLTIQYLGGGGIDDGDDDDDDDDNYDPVSWSTNGYFRNSNFCQLTCKLIDVAFQNIQHFSEAISKRSFLFFSTLTSPVLF